MGYVLKELAQVSILDVSTPPQGDHRETHMSQLVLMIAKIDQIDNPEKMTELRRQVMFRQAQQPASAQPI